MDNYNEVSIEYEADNLSLNSNEIKDKHLAKDLEFERRRNETLRE